MTSSKKQILCAAFLVVCYCLVFESLETKDLYQIENLSKPTILRKNGDETAPDRKIQSISSMESSTHDDQNIDSYCQKVLSSEIENIHDFLNRQILDYQKQVGSWFFEKYSPPQGQTERLASGNFLLGLARAGLLDGIPNTTTNKLEALQLLEKAHLLDPGNSAPLLYLAYLQYTLGLWEEERVTLSKIMMTDNYNSYIPEVKKTIFSTIRNPSDLFNAISIYSQIAIPSYGKRISDYVIQNRMSVIADQMLANELSRQSKPINIDSLLIETIVARHLLTKISPERRDISSKQWLSLIMKDHDITMDSSKLPPFTHEETGCDLSVYWPAVYDIQNSL